MEKKNIFGRRPGVAAQLALWLAVLFLLSAVLSRTVFDVGLFVILRKLIYLTLLYWLLGAIIPLLYHKNVSREELAGFSAAKLYEKAEAKEKVMFIDDNDEALKKRIEIIETAKQEIVYSTFVFSDDNSGTDVMSLLYEAAKRGVKVRLLVDGLRCMQFLHCRKLRALVSLPNVSVYAYNPPLLLKPWTIHARLHDKYILIDDKTYMIGGRNTNDLFLGDYSNKKNYDRELLVINESENVGSIAGLQRYFDSVLALNSTHKLSAKTHCERFAQTYEKLHKNYLCLQNVYSQAFRPMDCSSEMVAADNIVLLCNRVEATNKAPLLWEILKKTMLSGQRILVQTPYLILNNKMMDDLKEISGNCQNRPEFITNAVETGANAWGCSDYLNRKKRLLTTGWGIYECVSNDSCHLKSILIDDKLSLVGSFNFDMRSAYLDTELMLAVNSAELNDRLRQSAEESVSKSRFVSQGNAVVYGKNYEEIPMPTVKKLIYGIMRLLIRPIRHLL